MGRRVAGPWFGFKARFADPAGNNTKGILEVTGIGMASVHHQKAQRNEICRPIIFIVRMKNWFIMPK